MTTHSISWLALVLAASVAATAACGSPDRTGPGAGGGLDGCGISMSGVKIASLDCDAATDLWTASETAKALLAAIWSRL